MCVISVRTCIEQKIRLVIIMQLLIFEVVSNVHGPEVENTTRVQTQVLAGFVKKISIFSSSKSACADPPVPFSPSRSS